LTSNSISCTICSITTLNTRRITLFLTPALAKQAKAQAVIDDISLTTLVQRALMAFLPKETIIVKVAIGTDAES